MVSGLAMGSPDSYILDPLPHGYAVALSTIVALAVFITVYRVLEGRPGLLEGLPATVNRLYMAVLLSLSIAGSFFTLVDSLLYPHPSCIPVPLLGPPCRAEDYAVTALILSPLAYLAAGYAAVALRRLQARR